MPEFEVSEKYISLLCSKNTFPLTWAHKGTQRLRRHATNVAGTFHGVRAFEKYQHLVLQVLLVVKITVHFVLRGRTCCSSSNRISLTLTTRASWVRSSRAETSRSESESCEHKARRLDSMIEVHSTSEFTLWFCSNLGVLHVLHFTQGSVRPGEGGDSAADAAAGGRRRRRGAAHHPREVHLLQRPRAFRWAPDHPPATRVVAMTRELRLQRFYPFAFRTQNEVWGFVSTTELVSLSLLMDLTSRFPVGYFCWKVRKLESMRHKTCWTPESANACFVFLTFGTSQLMFFFSKIGHMGRVLGTICGFHWVGAGGENRTGRSTLFPLTSCHNRSQRRIPRALVLFGQFLKNFRDAWVPCFWQFFTK